VSKLAGEQYCRVFSELYGLETISLRYFNVYGPRQRPDSQYAAVIPLFIAALSTRDRPILYGDGHQSRDFTFVQDVIAANLSAMVAPARACSGKAYNVAGGAQHSLHDLLAILQRIMGVQCHPKYEDPRPGDVRHTRAEIEAAARDLGHRPVVDFERGLSRTVDWFRTRPLAFTEGGQARKAGPGYR
jgi:nucleoside-diphosphate-sugar epimerase